MSVVPFRAQPSAPTAARPPVPDENLIRDLDLRAPRYTSYPTADRFVEAFDVAKARSWLQKRSLTSKAALSLYVHLPFCASLCYYCACNKIITKDRSKAGTYLRYLERELDLTLAELGGDRKVSQMHWGGGTPTFLSSDELAQLMAMFRERFDFVSHGDYSIEIDPRTVSPDTVHRLGRLGMNRMSLGVQDFDVDVQRAVHRIQPVDLTLEVVAAAREAGFQSINFDLIYGLPRQSVARFERTLRTVLEARPQRIALYNYAHLPTRFKAQRRIHEADLPSPAEKIAIMNLAQQRLGEAGYVYVGIDHFALPDDELAVALRSGRLHRSFQGYTTQPDCDLIGLGVSAISKVGPTYSQSVRTLDEYYDAIDQGNLPTMRGIELTKDDALRRAVIMALMCQSEVSVESIELGHLIDFEQYFAPELQALAPYEAAGLLARTRQWISITPKGRHFLRAISATFDRYLRAEQARASYSKVI
jgi:oxygen-independent coproporphyrinogen-3 oxidase